MAKLALTVIGMGIGFALGGPFGAQIGAMVGGLVGNILFSPSVKGPRLTDLSVTASTYGQVIPEVYGTMRLGGNLIWSAGIKEHKHKSGGKGGPKTTTYTYTCSFAIAFCKGEIDGILRLWADGKLVSGGNYIHDSSGAPLTGVLAAGKVLMNLTGKKHGNFNVRVYTGTEDQTPDSTIIADKGEGNVPGYRDLAYIVFTDMPLENYGNRIPQITAEVTKQTIHTVPYTNFTSDPTYGDPSWHVGGTLDWSNSRFYKHDSTAHQLVTYDTRTMQELYRVNLSQTGGTPLYPNNALAVTSIGGKWFADNVSEGNIGRIGFWLTATGECKGTIGQAGNETWEDPMGGHDRAYASDVPYIVGGGTAMWFRILTSADQLDFLYHCGGIHGTAYTVWGVPFGTISLPDLPPTSPIHVGNVPFGFVNDWSVLRGKEVAGTLMEFGSADLLMVNSNYDTDGWSTWFNRVKFTDVSGGGIIPLYPPWDLGFDLFTSDVYTKLPHKDGEDLRMTNVAYDKSDNSLVIWGLTGETSGGGGGSWRFGKYLIDENEWKWYWKDTDLDPSLGNIPFASSAAQAVGYPIVPAGQSNLDGGTVGWTARPGGAITPYYLYVADLSTGEIKLQVAKPTTATNEPDWPFSAWDDNSQSLLGSPVRLFITAQGSGLTLTDIVDDVLSKTSALTTGDWDASALSGITVRGYTIAREASARDVLQQLASAYFFDGVESDYQIKCVPRGGAPVATITEKHLAWVENRDVSLKETRTQELDMPMRVTVTYSDFDRDYQDGTQSSKRNSDPFPTMNAHTEQKFELPIAMTATEAKQISDKALKMAWSNRTGYSLKFPWEFLKYDPSDVITIEMTNGTTYLMRLDKMNLGVDYSIETTGVSESAASYVSTAIGETGTIPTQQLRYAGPCDFFMLNTPLLRDTDDTQGVASVYYVSAAGQSPGDFISCYIFEATDTLATEYEDKDVITVEPIHGVALVALPDKFHYALDTTTVLTVRILSVDDDGYPSTLESCTYDELLAGKNYCIVGDEVIQFMTATVGTDGRTYTLTGLLRARRGTNFAAVTHTSGERFLMLATDGSVIKQINGPTEWSTTHYFKPVATGQFVEDVTRVVAAMEPNDLKPYSPECVKATDDGTDITITFVRRSRISNELVSGGSDIPYKEGQGTLAHFVYNVWSNKLLTDTPWSAGITPDFTGQVAIYSGLSFADLTFNFVKVGINNFVVELYEVGFVNGFSKYVQFVNVPGTTEWDMTELY